jgi:hypothetical protein
VSSTILVTGSDRRSSLSLAAAVAVEIGSGGGTPTLLAELGPAARRRPATLLAAPAARRLEDSLRAAGHRGSARGHLCHLALQGEEDDPLDVLCRAVDESDTEVVVAHLPGALWVPALESRSLGAVGGCILVELPRQRSLAALATSELAGRGLRAQVATSAPPPLAARRALAGVPPGGRSAAGGRRIARRLLGLGPRDAPEREGERGQALPAVLGAGAVLIIAALLLAAIGGAVAGKGRVQRAADLAALSAARSMRDDVSRLLEPARLPDGAPNPDHLPRRLYFERARLAATGAARSNGVDPARLRIDFPDATSRPPLQARARIEAEIDPRELPGGERLEGARREPIEVTASAVAEASPPAGSWSGMPAQATGGGYSGPLVYRNGEGMRPDVAAAFDRMAAAARGAGHSLVVTSGFRSDAEQAELFERHPDPTWVAPPGRSLHRCATELDLGPSTAYSWLAANARRFGFLQRYSWEPWHYGYAAGPPPCSAAGNAGGGAGAVGHLGDPDGSGSRSALPSFVPARYRAPLLRSAGRWNVSAGLLAAQLMAESGFDPRAVSPAGALGIAQFMPGTAASYGLRDPFDPIAAIDAQAHLMSDLLRQFRSVPLALAAYNAGPGAVGACSCIPPYPETRAYVARVLALAGGTGAILTPPLEVRLVE